MEPPLTLLRRTGWLTFCPISSPHWTGWGRLQARSPASEEAQEPNGADAASLALSTAT